jgi:hypothetical protein
MAVVEAAMEATKAVPTAAATGLLINALSVIA